MRAVVLIDKCCALSHVLCLIASPGALPFWSVFTGDRLSMGFPWLSGGLPLKLKCFQTVTMFILLLSGPSCCLCFSIVVFAVWAVWFSCCLGAGVAPAQAAKKKKHDPLKQNKWWAGRCFYLLLLFGRGGRCFFVCCLGEQVRIVFCCSSVFPFLAGPGKGRLFCFAVRAWGHAFCCCLGGGRASFLAVWAGDGSSHLRVCLARL